MFWKWKGKKKDGEEPGSAESESSAVTTKTGDESAEESEPEAAEDSGTTDNEAATDTGTADTADADTLAAESGGTKESEPAAEAAADDVTASTDETDGADDAEESEDGAGEATDSAAEEAAEDAEPEVPGTTEPDSEGVQRVRTSGALNVDDDEFEVVSNTWIIDADDDGVIVIDPAHDAQAILDAVGEREIYLVACTNGYNTHISAAIDVAERDEAPIALHPRELRSWRKVHGAERRPDLEIEGGGTLEAGDLEIDVLAIPGTSNGSVGLYISERGVVFSGDTLRKGELGTVGDGYIDYTRQLHSVGEVLLSLPPDTRVLPDSGPETTVERESKNFDAWVATS
ncbi:MBL fold metallo-hydrolase [Lipingzhangella halophila]|uniref:MBL fold metallo-hydrolase n=1 Tax=Lipingzhangella halophila TaxID=1783352 RepID=UPI0016116178|nr:MBL fold metallo-hydrolase [Lipingzhangella halophila]